MPNFLKKNIIRRFLKVRPNLSSYLDNMHNKALTNGLIHVSGSYISPTEKLIKLCEKKYKKYFYLLTTKLTD